MAGLICLTMAAICAVTARVLLLIAALDICVWWALGVFISFGPLLFRLSYPEQARRSFIFRVGTLVCIFLYVALGPGALISPRYRAVSRPKSLQLGYATEFVSKIFSSRAKTSAGNPVRPEERRAANARE